MLLFPYMFGDDASGFAVVRHGMNEVPTHDDVDPVTDTFHEGSWSANLEREQYADDPELVIEHAIDAVDQTAAGTHVNLVTHGNHGHPAAYLMDALDAELAGTCEVEYVDQCGCGGHVTRVHVE